MAGVDVTKEKGRVAGVDVTKERGQMTGVDLKILISKHLYLVEKLNAPQLINELFQNEVIDQDDMTIITKEHDKSRRQGVKQMLKIIYESGLKAFDGFVESLRMAGFTDMARRLQEDHKSRMRQQAETETLEPKDGDTIKELMERLCVAGKFNFAKLEPHPRFNTDGIKTSEDIIERKKDWDRKKEVWRMQRKDCLNKLLNWWEGKQYENVEVFKLDVKEWSDVLYKCLVSDIEMLDSLIEWSEFIFYLSDDLYDSLGWYNTDESQRQMCSKREVRMFEEEQVDITARIEKCINRLNQIPDEGKDNTGTGSSIILSLYFDKVDLTTTKNPIDKIYKQLK